jgi:N-acetylmuramoyl-L-alanine amidase CwlA
MNKVAKPPINVLLAHPSNTWSRWVKINDQSVFLDFENIVLHYVGAVSTAKNNAVYLNREPNLGWSAHFFVDEHEIWQSVSLDRAAGHCGVDYSGGKAPFQAPYVNKKSIGIEMCCKKDKNGNWYIEPETVTRTVALVKWLMQEFNIPAANVIRHYDVCWKQCPEPWVRDESQWKAFKQRISESEEEIDMTVEQVKQLIKDEVTETTYGDITDVPDYWEGDIRQLLDMGVIDGGTPAEKNDHDVNLNRTEAKVLVIVMRILKKLGVME